MPAVGLLILHLHIGGAHSLKQKRQVLRSLKDRLRSRCNVSVAETGFLDSWQRSVVAVAAVSSAEAQVEKLLRNAEREAEALLGADLTRVELELL